MQTCTKCKVLKPLTDFHKNRRRSSGRSLKCKVCACAQSRDWHAANPSRSKNTKLQNAYGISFKEYSDLKTFCNGRCTICDQVCPSGRALAVDHDHQNGVIRGLLCINCNKGLGNFKDSIRLLQAAIGYLTAYNEALLELGAEIATDAREV